MQTGGFTPFPLLYLSSLRILYDKSELDAQGYAFFVVGFDNDTVKNDFDSACVLGFSI
jgi:hypothetical protein